MKHRSVPNPAPPSAGWCTLKHQPAFLGLGHRYCCRVDLGLGGAEAADDRARHGRQRIDGAALEVEVRTQCASCMARRRRSCARRALRRASSTSDARHATCFIQSDARARCFNDSESTPQALRARARRDRLLRGGARAIARACRLPLAERGTLTVVYVLSDRVPKKARAGAEKLARRQLEHAKQSISKATAAAGRPDIKVSAALCQGQPYVEIIRRARAVAADLIVVGRHGARPLRDMFIGSTAERVMRAADLPVLVVSGKANRGYRQPIFAVALQDTCRAAVATALRVLEPTVTSGTLVHAYHVPFEGFVTPTPAPERMSDLRREYRQMAVSGLAKLEASFAGFGLEWQKVVVRGDARSVILAEAARRGTDLLAVGTHARSGIAHALVGSVAEWVICAAPCDVLVARPARVSFELP